MGILPSSVQLVEPKVMPDPLGDRIPERDANPTRRGRVFEWSALALVAWLGSSYRLYLARYHTEVGIPGMAPWWDYVIDNARGLKETGKLASAFYPPGQSVTAYLIGQVFPLEPAVLRVCFGLLDGIAILFLFLLTKELAGRRCGFAAALLYALWPEAASASINILHDHSPQPLFLFAGFWLLLLWFRHRSVPLLVLSGALLGMVPLYRTDAVIVTLAAPAGLGLALWVSESRGKAISSAAILFLSTLAPSLPYDLLRLSQTGTWVHIAAGDPGSAVFIRFGRNGGLAGTRHSDREVARVSGVGEPFGRSWNDTRRMKPLARWGQRLFLNEPVRYLDLVAGDSWSHLVTASGNRRWWPGGAPSLMDAGLAFDLRNPEWPLVGLTSWTGIQRLLDRPLILLLGAIGLLAGAVRFPLKTLPMSLSILAWITALLLLVPTPRYLLMPLCLSFAFIPLSVLPVISLATKWSRSQPRETLESPRREVKPGVPMRFPRKTGLALATGASLATFGWVLWPRDAGKLTGSISFSASYVHPLFNSAVYTRMRLESGAYEIVSKDLRTGAVTPLSVGERTVTNGVFNGKRFLYSAIHGNTETVVLGSADGTAPIIRQADWVGERFPTFHPTLTPDGAWTAYQWGGDEVRIRSLRTGEEERFGSVAPPFEAKDSFRGSAARFVDFSLSPDGRRLVLVRIDGGRFSLRIYPRGSSPTEFEQIRESERVLACPRWLPDGSGITFIEQTSEGWSVARWQAARGQRHIYSSRNLIESAELHPDGRHLLATLGDQPYFRGYFDGLHVCEVDLQTGEIKRIGA